MSIPNILDQLCSTSSTGITFCSTRDQSLIADCWETLINGQAPNNGLYVPKLADLQSVAFDSDFFDTPTSDAEPKLANLSLPQISALLLRKFIPTAELSNQQLQAMMNQAHSGEIPFDQLDENTIIAWLDQFETASFKDFAARAIAQLMEAWCKKNQTPKNIVVATSGDTGVAIASAFAGSKWVTVTVMYPAGKVSTVQEAQMIDVAERNDNVQCLPTEGDFDRCQGFSKAMQSIRDLDPNDPTAVTALVENLKGQLNVSLSENEITDLYNILKDLNLASANSINIWRLIPQMTQYFASYAKALKTGQIQSGEAVVFAVPTGNVGHLMAGVYAKALGLPVAKFVVGTNSNDIVTHALRDGVLKHNNLKRNAKGENEADVTASPSMDIADPSNLERLLEFAQSVVDPHANIDFAALKVATKTLEPGSEGLPLKQFGVSDKILYYLQSNFYADSATDHETTDLMQRKQNQVQLEPHGAAAVKALETARETGFVAQEKVIVLETASRDKFPEALQAAGIEVTPSHPVLKQLNTKGIKNPETIIGTVLNIAEKVQAIAAASAKARAA